MAHFSVSVKTLNCDFLVFSGHKMYGPTGIGVLYGKRERLEKMDPVLFGGDMIKEVTFAKAIWMTYRGFKPVRPISGAIGSQQRLNLQRIGWLQFSDEVEVMLYAMQITKDWGSRLFYEACRCYIICDCVHLMTSPHPIKVQYCGTTASLYDAMINTMDLGDTSIVGDI